MLSCHQKLRDHAPTVDFATVHRVVQEDLGASVDTLYHSFDPQPFAAASLAQVRRVLSLLMIDCVIWFLIHFFLKKQNHKPFAGLPVVGEHQVHRAVTSDGDRVAVKIQFPELRRQFEGDMFVHQFVLRAAGWLFRGADLLWMHEEIEGNLRKGRSF
jgi:predicted unusual protein kinase regulating ubiquinone biosynthesis (AarF/ABC1/UbiB family)